MSELKKKNLFIEINESQFIIAAGIYDEELNFSIIDKKIIFLTKKDDQEILDNNVNELKKGINEVEKILIINLKMPMLLLIKAMSV